MMDDEALIEEFETCRWPLDQWHHREHIKIAYLYLRRYPFEAAVVRIREKLRAYAAANNVPDSATSGYHETMTQAWMRLVHLTLCEYGPAENSDAFYEQSPQLSQQKTLRLFYTREVFMSPRAKAEFLEPDLASLPRSRKNGENRGLP